MDEEAEDEGEDEAEPQAQAEVSADGSKRSRGRPRGSTNRARGRGSDNASGPSGVGAAAADGNDTFGGQTIKEARYQVTHTWRKNYPTPRVMDIPPSAHMPPLDPLSVKKLEKAQKLVMNKIAHNELRAVSFSPK